MDAGARSVRCVPAVSKHPVLHDPALGDLTDDALTRDYRVYQRAKGHRFSSDDMATAHVAWRAASSARKVLDLGCGLGSVLLQLAWTLKEASFVGVEAQSSSFELLRRNVERNSLGHRVTIHHGDLRDPAVVAGLGTGFDLITGTPPYFPPDTASDALDEQRAYARIEYRGGVEAYIATGARLLAEGGVLVLCGDARAGLRVERATTEAGLFIAARCDIIPYEERPALFSIWTLLRRPSARALSALTLRDAEGRATADARRLRAFSGFDP